MSKLIFNRDGGSADQYGHLLALNRFLTGEVIEGLSVGANGSPNMTVIVQPGSGRIPTGSTPSNYGYFFGIDTVVGESVGITTANGSNPRNDLIVVYVDLSITASQAQPNNPNNMLKLLAVAGTPNASPVDPNAAAIQAAVGAGNPYIILARAVVGANVTQITNANITDRRYMIPAATGWAPGDIKETAIAAAPTGWLLCDGTPVSRSTYAPLFAAIGTTYGGGDGSTTFNVPDLRSRVPIGAGPGQFISSFAPAAVNTSTNVITVPANTSLQTGTPVLFTTTGTAPTGLTNNTTYYVIRQSSTTLFLASSLALAISNIGVTISGQGTGTHTLTETLTNNALGSVGGEETHALTTNEIPSHNHAGQGDGNLVTGGSGGTAASITQGGAAFRIFQGTAFTGGSAPHNNLSPFLAINYLIKT